MSSKSSSAKTSPTFILEPTLTFILLIFNPSSTFTLFSLFLTILPSADLSSLMVLGFNPLTDTTGIVNLFANLESIVQSIMTTKNTPNAFIAFCCNEVLSFLLTS